MLQLKTIDDKTSKGEENATAGLGLPRVELTDVNELYPMFLSDPGDPESGANEEYLQNKTLIDSQHKGLIVYNTGAGKALPEGIYYWNGAEWKILDSFRSVSPSIESLNCESATLSPAAYQSGVPYEGIMKITYGGGNGGFYDDSNSYTSNGLEFKLQAGKLENGTGELTFSVKGIPSSASANAITIPLNGSNTGKIEIPFWKGECNAMIKSRTAADTKTIAEMGPFTYTTAAKSGRDGYEFVAVTPDGRFAIRAFIPEGKAFASANLQLKSNIGDVEIASVEGTWWSGGTYSNSRNTMPVKGGVWGGNANNVSNDRNTWVSQTEKNDPAWGNEEVYASSSPEHRMYAFTVADGADKVFYSFSFMMMTMDSGGHADDKNCPDGTCGTTKAYFKIDQITAQ